MMEIISQFDFEYGDLTYSAVITSGTGGSLRRYIRESLEDRHGRENAEEIEKVAKCFGGSNCWLEQSDMGYQ